MEISSAGPRTVRKAVRAPERTGGQPPKLRVELSAQDEGASRSFNARAQITEGSAAIYYTTGTDRTGVYQNTMVLWELYGPEEADYRQLTGQVAQPFDAGRSAVVETRFNVSQPGRYRLRAATADLAGRSAVVWKEFTIGR